MSNIIDSIQVSGTVYQIQGSGGGNNVIELTQAQYDALVDKDPTALYIITDAEAVDLANYYTKSQTSGATQISTALNAKADTATTYTKTEVDNAITAATSTKQDTLVSGTNIKTINNESILGSGNITIQGGGGASYQAGRGIDITDGTISFNLPISAGTGDNSIIEGKSTSAMSYGDHAEGYFTYANGNGYAAHAEGYQTSAMTYSSHAEGRLTKAAGEKSHAEGSSTVASGNSSHAEGASTNAIGSYSHTEGFATSATSVSNVSGIVTYAGYQARHAEGAYTKANNGLTHTEGYFTVANNFGEHASGVYNASNSATTTFSDSGNTLFSVGNGTADNARHNAFEIRQNGDIYCSDGTNDVKLQDTITATAANTTALGGLKLVKLSQAEYDALTTKDSNTLYVIV